MIKIELLGAPGVGKSTFYNKLLKRKRAVNWLTPREGIIDAVKSNHRISLLPNRRNLIKIGVLQKFHYNWSKEILFSNKRHLIHKFSLKNGGLIEAYLNSISKTQIDDYYKIYLLEQLLGYIEEVIILDEYQKEKIVFWDEGIAQNAKVFEKNEYFKKFNNNEIPQVIFHCDLEIDENIKRLKKRMDDNSRSLDKRIKELGIDSCTFCKNNHDLINDKLKVLEQMGTRVIKLDLSNEDELNFGLVDQTLECI